jgi:hypothetical protein
VDREVLLGLARCERLYRMTFQSKSNDGGHVTSKVTMPMMASFDTGISNGKLLLITLRVLQSDVNANSQCSPVENDRLWTRPSSRRQSGCPSMKEGAYA